jgi:hypothetical protein
LIRELSKIDYRKFIYEFFSMLNEYKNFGLKMIDIEGVVNDIFADQSKYFDGNIINEDKLGFNTEELKCFCPSPFFWDIAYKVKNGRKFLDSDVTRGIAIYEKVWQYNPDLLEEADVLAEKDRLANEQKAISSDNKLAEITLDLVQQMVEWDKRKRILEDWKWKAMKDVVDGKKELSERMKYAFYLNLQILRKKGFQG